MQHFLLNTQNTVEYFMLGAGWLLIKNYAIVLLRCLVPFAHHQSTPYQTLANQILPNCFAGRPTQLGLLLLATLLPAPAYIVGGTDQELNRADLEDVHIYMYQFLPACEHIYLSIFLTSI